MGESAFAALNPVAIVIALATVILAGKFKVSPIAIIVGAGVLGAILCG